MMTQTPIDRLCFEFRYDMRRSWAKTWDGGSDLFCNDTSGDSCICILEGVVQKMKLHLQAKLREFTLLSYDMGERGTFTKDDEE